MSNMNYCRFNNTLKDMYDCLNTLREGVGNEVIKSQSEMDNAKEMLKEMVYFLSEQEIISEQRGTDDLIDEYVKERCDREYIKFDDEEEEIEEEEEEIQDEG